MSPCWSLGRATNRYPGVADGSTLVGGDFECRRRRGRLDSQEGRVGIDAQYITNGFGFRGQFNYSKHSNTFEYNQFTDSDLGSQLMGFYLEASYNVFQAMPTKHQLIPFVRYENYNTHAAVSEGIIIDETFARQEYIFGLGWKMHPNAMLKADYQILNEGSNSKRNFFNMNFLLT